MKAYYRDAQCVIYHADYRQVVGPLIRRIPDLVIADPPYGKKVVKSNGQIGLSKTRYRPVHGDDSTDTAILGYGLCASLFPEARHVWWGGNYYAHALPPSACWLVWDKETTGHFADCELAWTNQRTPARRFRHRWSGFLRDSERGKRVHPTQKPVALMEWIITWAGDVKSVLEPFMGSGPAVRAAKMLGLKAVGIEIDEHYCEIVAKRLESGDLLFD